MTSNYRPSATALSRAEERTGIEASPHPHRAAVAGYLSCFGLVVLISLTACASGGPKRLPGDRFDYSEAISRSSKEQMLANIVRFRYLDFPVFMAVSSVITSYSYEGGVGVEGTAGLSEVAGGDSVTGGVNLAYSERPTVTYAPLSGQEFTRRMLAPISVQAIFALGQTGWDIEQLLLTGINRINDVENLSFEVAPTTRDVEKDQQLRQDIENIRRFQRVIELLLDLTEQEVIELQRPEGDSGLPNLVFDYDVPQAFQPAVAELRDLLNLDTKRDVFRVTTRLARRNPDEITIHSRSLLAIMSFLAKGVEIPEAHLADGWAEPFKAPPDASVAPYIPLRIRSQQEPPGSAFAAVRYQGYWFYIEQADLESKAMFQMLLALFELQAPAGGTAAPLLTLPAGN